jgi:uroporphyrinogen decarboxylase
LESSSLFEEGGLPDGVWVYEDLGYRDRLFCSVGMLEELIFPYYTELVDFFHGYDLPVVLHSCGYQEPMIPLAVKAGFDALNPMEVKAGNDILKYAELYRDDLCFIGGLDAMVLESGDRPLIKKEVTKLVKGMRERGARFIYGSDHSLSPNISYSDYQYSLEIYRSVMASA